MQKSQILKILPRLLTAGAVPNRTTLSSALSVCGRLRKAFLGPAIHTHIIKSGDQLCKDVSVNSALVFMYSKCAELGSAQKVFKSMPERNVVSWNSIISAHAESNNEADAWGVFVEMLTDGCQPSEVTLTGMATVSPRIAEGRVVHGLVTKLGLAEEITGAAIVEMYVRLESLVDAQKVFDQIPRTEMGSWNAIISGYARNGQAREALDLFNQLRDHTSLRLNSITLGGALTACAALGAFREGKAIHNYAISHNISLDLKLATSLINMYSKCGSVDKAREVFEGMEERDIVAWSVMISGHGVNGQAGEALELFDRMVRDEGLRPDNVAFTAVLSACSHAGMLQEGWEYFNQMKRVYKLEPENEQYACVVDLLGRAGKLDEALGFIEKMPINPSPVAMDAMEEDDSQLPTQIVPAAPPMAPVPALAPVPIPPPIAPVPALALLPIPPPIAPIPLPPASLLRARAAATAVRPESDSDSDDSPPPPHSAADYEISEASRLARERQEKILQDHLMKRHALAMAVPTKDAEVRARLRRLAEPVTLFGEREMERRDRLRSIMVHLHSEGQLDRILKAHEEDQEAAAAEDPGEELRYPFFTPGPPELLEARKDIAFYSLQRAMVRLARERRRREDRDEDEDAEAEYVVNQARQFVLECSEIGDDRPLSGCSFSQDGSMLATSSWSGTAKVWSMPQVTKVATLKGHRERVTDLSFSPVKDLLATASADYTAKLWNPDGTLLRSFGGHLDRLARVSFHPSGKYIGTTSFDKTWRLWDVDSGMELLLQEGHSRAVYGLCFHPDGSLAASCGLDALARVWDLRTGRSILVFEGHVKQVLGASFSPNGYLLATAGEDNTCRIWDLRKRKCVYVIPAHSHLISQVKFEPQEGYFLATASYDTKAMVWSAQDFTPIRTLAGHEAKVTGLDITGDGQLMATVSHDRTIKIWSSRSSGKEKVMDIDSLAIEE